MKVSKNYLFSINLDCLVCSIYTLSGNDDFFKSVSLTSYIYLNKNGRYNFYLGSIDDFYSVLNKPGLRRLTFQVVKTFLKKGGLIKNSHNKNTMLGINTIQEKIFLKKYLKKFKYYYYRHFFRQNIKRNLPTDKELNMAAIKSLFLLVGI